MDIKNNWQAHEINTYTIFCAFRDYINRLPISGRKKNQTINFVHSNIKRQCNRFNIDFDDPLIQPYIIVGKEYEDIYAYFLTIYLQSCPEEKLELFLNRQAIYYPAGEQQFINLIEHIVLDLVVLTIDPNNQKLRNSIAKWIAEKQLEKKVLRLPKNKDTKYNLEWDSRYINELKNISIDLFDSRYTINSIAFQNSFIKKKKIKWLKTPEFLAYLLRVLYYHKYSRITVTPKSNYFWKAAKNHFYCVSKETIAVEKFEKFLSDKANKITMAKYHKHKLVKEKVDELISNYIKPS